MKDMENKREKDEAMGRAFQMNLKKNAVFKNRKEKKGEDATVTKTSFPSLLLIWNV